MSVGVAVCVFVGVTLDVGDSVQLCVWVTVDEGELDRVSVGVADGLGL